MDFVREDAANAFERASPAITGLEIKLLGQFALRWQGRPVEVKSRKSKALLGYLALSEGRSESRERLVGLLWSEADDMRARQSLRQSLHEIRQAFAAAGVDGMITDRLLVGLTMERADVDVMRVVDEARVGRPGPRLFERDHLFDSLLDQFETIDPAYRTWLLPRRRSLELRVTAYFEQHMRDPSLEPAVQEANARALLRLDPTNEKAMRVAMTARAMAGDVGGALRLYKQFWTLLDEEYGQEPSPETQDLAVTIKMQPPGLREPGSNTTSSLRGSSGSPFATPGDLKLTVCIGVFDVSAVAAEHRYLVQGFRRELIASLVRFREWVVRDADGPKPGVPDGGEAGMVRLDVHAVGGRDTIRMVLTTQHAANKEYIWSDELKLSLSTWGEAQETVVRRLASALQVNVSAGRLAAIRRHDLGSLLAYDLWLQGQERIHSWEPRAWAEAKQIFGDVVRTAPSFAPAYSCLAQLENTVHFAHPGLQRDPARAAQAIAFAAQATRIDPVDSRAQLALGWSYLMAGHYQLAIEHALIALDLNETDQLTTLSTAQCLAFCGDHARAGELVARARRIFPHFTRLHWAYLVGIRFLAGDYAGAVEASESEKTLIPTLIGFRIAACHHIGESELAERERAAYFDDLRARWADPMPATDDAIRAWFLSASPIRLRADWERLRDGFDGA